MTDISLRFEPPFARIVLNRPDRRNAISHAMWRALPSDPRGDRGREDSWSRSLRARAKISAPAPTSLNSEKSIATPTATRDYGDAVQDGLKALMDLDRPTIAVIRGVAIGGGLAFARLRSALLRR